MDGGTRSHVSFEDASHLLRQQTSLTETNGSSPRDYFSAEGSDDEMVGEDSESYNSRRKASLNIRIPPTQAKADMAFTALQYLPMPVLVLSSMKTVVLANEAMGRLLGIDPEADDDEEDEQEMNPLQRLASRDIKSATDVLQGVTLGQLGLDLLQNGSPVFVAWEDFLETVVDDASRAQCSATQLNTHHGRRREKDDTTPTGTTRHKRSVSTASSAKLSQASSSGTRTEVHDAIVDVVFSTNRDCKTGLPLVHKNDSIDHVQAQMIVSIWATEDEQYYTLTFTAGKTERVTSPTPSEGAGTGTKTTSRTVSRTPTSYSNSVPSGLSSNSSSSSRQSGLKRSVQTPPSSTYASPTTIPQMDFPPRGPPTKSSQHAAPTMFSKTNRLKEALLNSMNIPAYAMWKDESFGIPNKAAINLIYPWLEDGKWDSSEQARDFLSHYTLYYEDFSAEIPLEDFPILRLMREREAFEGYRVGMYSAKDGSSMLFDVCGEPLIDEKGEFLGGLVLFYDVTGFAKTINRQQRQNDEQFEDICNMVPQMIWRTTPTGQHDYFSDRWYDYTGLTPEESLGEGWINAFDPADIEIAVPIWEHSLATGDEYRTEYRARSRTGEWRWMLGRAVPMRGENGEIVKWFGTCTDVHEQVVAREEAKQMKSQLELVIEHAQITLWAVDTEMRLTLAEGRSMSAEARQGEDQEFYHGENRYTGMNLFDIFEKQGRGSEKESFLRPIRNILEGRVKEEIIETQISTTKRWYRTRLYPLLRQERKGHIEGDSYIDGVVGVSMDVTDQRKAADQLAERDRVSTTDQCFGLF